MLTTTRSAGGRRRLVGSAALAVSAALAAVLATSGTAQAWAPAPGAGPVTTTRTPVDYTCFVTYQGGATTVHYALTFTAAAPKVVRPWTPFTVTLTEPVITPNPRINTRVADLQLVYRVPAGARLLGATMSGGSGLGPAGARLVPARDAVALTAAGPFPAGKPFTLPLVELSLLAGPAGSAAVAQGGATLAQPAFSWVRTDPTSGVARPFGCFVASPVPLTATTVAGG